MNILIIANFTRDFSESDNGRFLYLAKRLSEKHNVEIITTEFSHGKKDRKSPIVIQYPFKITLLKEPGYKKNVSFKRFYSHAVWGKNLRDYLETIPKPDVVYCAVPSLTGPRYAVEYCKKYNIRFIVDIQDLWPEAFKMVLNIPVLSNFIFFPFKKKANYIYKNADAVCAVSNTYVRRALDVNPDCKETKAVFIGTEFIHFDNAAMNNPPNFEKTCAWIGYCGSLGNSYDLPCVFNALEILKLNYNKEPLFIVMGDGARRSEFEQIVKAKKLNVRFMGFMKYEKMCGILSKCDIVINPIAKGSAATIINKHADYAASGAPVINTQESEEYRSLVENYKMGFNCNNGDAAAIAEKVNFLLERPEYAVKLGKNARKCGEENFDRKKSYQSIIALIENNRSM
ncbi:MAG: glycosyltransferase family 4 protein [Ruminococcus sp.]|nr:glycosyltransferase family 4 protein [Ruminococcus sp.]